MRRQLSNLAVLAVMGAAAVACGSSGPREFGKEDGAALRKMTQEFQDAYNAKDSARVAQCFSGFGWRPCRPTPRPCGVRSAIKGYYDLRFGEGATDLKLDPTTVNGAGTLAYMAGTYSFRNAPTAGPKPATVASSCGLRGCSPRQRLAVRGADVEQRPAAAGARAPGREEGRQEVGGQTGGRRRPSPSRLSRPS